jgi:hypothetical protein
MVKEDEMHLIQEVYWRRAETGIGYTYGDASQAVKSYEERNRQGQCLDFESRYAIGYLNWVR